MANDFKPAESLSIQREQLPVGAWVRFMSGGRVVIGCVLYQREVYGHLELTTDAGVTRGDYVLEVR